MKWLSKLKRPVMRLTHTTCKDTSSVISEMMDHPVSFKKLWRTKIHMAMCCFCRYYKTQLETLTRLTDELSNDNSPVKIDFALSPKSKPPMEKTLNSEPRGTHLNEEKPDE